jgi:hypothetical protein
LSVAAPWVGVERVGYYTGLASMLKRNTLVG